MAFGSRRTVVARRIWALAAENHGGLAGSGGEDEGAGERDWEEADAREQ